MEATNRFQRFYINIRRFFRAVQHRIIRLYKSIEFNEVSGLVLLALFVGIIGGYVAVGFRILLAETQRFFWGAPESVNMIKYFVPSLLWFTRILIPVIGGLIIGPIIYFFVREAKGSGVPEVMEAILTKGGHMRSRIVPLKAVISVLCIGSGGSCGREGPIVQIGSGAGSALGQYLNLSERKRKTLIGCGAAAGIAGTFNAPIGGMMFSLEILLGQFNLRQFSPLVVSSVIGTVISHAYLGANPAFDIPEYTLVSSWEIIPYCFLGIIGAGVGLLFTKSLYKTEELFNKLNIPEYLKPGFGGALLGLLALPLPQLYSVGYSSIEQALSGNIVWWLLGVLAIGKILATNLTLGSGGSGGIFAPSLFIGAMAGGIFGEFVHTMFPDITGAGASYAVVGMGAVVSGAAHAPLTAILILFEMTRDYHLILPLMLSCIISSVISSQIQGNNIYTTKLINRGIDIHTGSESTLLRTLRVKDAMNREVITLNEDDDTETIQQIFKDSHHTHYPVVNKTGEVVGILNYTQYWAYMEEEPTGKLLIARDLANKPATVRENQSLLTALKKISSENTELLPVVSEEDNRKLIAVLSRNDIINTYNKRLREEG